MPTLPIAHSWTIKPEKSKSVNKNDSRPVSRRTVIKVYGAAALALYLRKLPAQSASPETAAIAARPIADISPIDRGLSDVAPAHFFGDEPQIPHKILWDKPAYLASLGDKPPAETERVPLVIIGGGISGLSSAWLLRKHSPVVLEQAARFGGNAQGQSWRGVDYAIGAAYYLQPEQGSGIARLLAELGVDKLGKSSSESAPFELDGRIHQDFWAGRTAPKLRGQFLKLSAYFRGILNGKPHPYPDIPIVDPRQESYIKQLDRESFAAHLQKIAGQPLHLQIEPALEHYCWSAFGGSMTEISAAAGLNFYAAEFGSLIALPGGNAAIAERMLERLAELLPPGNLRPGSLVFDVKVLADGVRVSYASRDGQVHSLHAQAAILACPKFVAAKLLDDMEAERRAAIARLKYRSYLVANVLLRGRIAQRFYNFYLLGDGKTDLRQVQTAAQDQGVTDIVLGNYARPAPDTTVLTLYRALPYDGARPALYADDAYAKFRQEFETQIHRSILPLLGLAKAELVDLRIARWGHPLPLAATGLIADGTVETLRKPFRDRVFFVEQDNWALPAFETSLTEALTWAPVIDRFLGKEKS